MEQFIEILVYNYLWGLPMVILVLGSGFYITLRTGFFQFRNFKLAMSKTIESIFHKDKGENNEPGVLSPLEALSTALGTTIGVGNIGGVGAAVAIGGPGAIFWMWVAGLFGMIIKMTEITLAVHYRTKLSDNETYGGPNYYIKKGIGTEKKSTVLYKILGFIFAFGFMTGYFINIQTYTVAEAVGNTFNLGMISIAIFYTVSLYIMISGGMKSVAKFAVKMVPFMCIFYLAASVFIIVTNLGKVPEAFGLIFNSAFNPTAALGGFTGASVSLAIRTGMSRSVFSNEAGWGSAPMIHASAKVNHPIKQGIMGIFEVFVDTFVICTCTGLVIMVTGVWSSGLDGATLTLSAFETGIGVFGRFVIAIGVFLFGLTTSSGIYAQIEVVVRYIIGDSTWKNRILQFYKWTYPLPSLGLVYIAVYQGYPGTTVWLFSDASTSLPIFANLIALVILTPKFLDLINDYKARYLGIGKVNLDFKVFYEDRKHKK